MQPTQYVKGPLERLREREGKRDDIGAEDDSREQDRRFNLLILGTCKALLILYN
jgi:hypothetical protein